MLYIKEHQLRAPFHGPSFHVPAPPSAHRVLQFMGTGALAGLVQMCLLSFFLDAKWEALPAGFLAAFLGAQLNFVLSTLITWHDRPAEVLWRRWLLYLGSVSGTMVLNVLVFSMLHLISPVIVASASAIALTGIANFMLGDNLIFRQHPSLVAEEHRLKKHIA
jgi:putative flippase GtrA